jgi:drug/metabolite transporter (DMT)-like permease
MSVPEIVNITVQTPYPGTETWLTESRRLTTLDYRLFDVQHAVLPTRLPLHRFYEELVKTQAVLARKHLGAAALAKTTGIVARQLLRGQTNFVRMLWKFDKVYNADRQYSEHLREAEYLLPPPAERPAAAAGPGRKDLYVHAPLRRRSLPAWLWFWQVWRAGRRDRQLSTPIAVVAALAGSVVFGISSVAEQRGTKRVKRRRALSPRILLDLVRQPLWVAAIGAILVGFALQVVALTFGPLALVEPILVCDLIFAVLISAYLRRRWDPVMLAGVAACSAGVAGFLVIARPSGGRSAISFHVVLPLAAGLAAAVAGCLAVARRNQNLRPLALALACGVSYGTAAFLVKLVTAEAAGGLLRLLSHWPIYALAVVGPVGFVLNQDAFQQGTLLAPVLAIITASDPLVSIALAYFWLHEKLSGSPAAIAGEVTSLLLMTTGIVVIAHHSPQVVKQQNELARRADASPGPSPGLARGEQLLSPDGLARPGLAGSP